MSYVSQTINFFYSEQDAKDHRLFYGTGGWIFVDSTGEAFLFSPNQTPSMIFNHPMTSGRSGILV